MCLLVATQPDNFGPDGQPIVLAAEVGQDRGQGHLGIMGASNSDKRWNYGKLGLDGGAD
jgi:hypothetical protein